MLLSLVTATTRLQYYYSTGRWKEHFDELLNPTAPSLVEAQLEVEKGSLLICPVEVTEVVENSAAAKPRDG